MALPLPATPLIRAAYVAVQSLPAMQSSYLYYFCSTPSLHMYFVDCFITEAQEDILCDRPSEVSIVEKLCCHIIRGCLLIL